MLKNLLWSFLLFLSAHSLVAQSQLKTDIEIDIKNYSSDTLIFGYYLADKMLVKDSLIRTGADQPFSIKTDTLLDPGMYILVSVPEGMFYQLLVGEEDQQFNVAIDTMSNTEIVVEGDTENKVFYDYLNFVNDARVEKSRLDKVIMETDSVMVSVRDQLFKDRLMIDQLVSQRQSAVVEEYPESIASILIKSNLTFNFPEFTGTEAEIQNQKYKYYKKHYFDLIDLDHRALIRTPVAHQRINYYMESLTPMEPDSIIESVDYLLGEMDMNSEIYRYYLSYFLNKYGNSKFIGMDAIYVHLALNYYGKDKAPWVTEENKNEIVSNAKKIEPILIGKPAPDFTIYQEDGTPVSLAALDNDYTVLVFWKPDCAHCTKAMPHVVEFQEKYKDKGVQVISICTKNGKDFGKCWEDVKKKGMDNLINCGDQYNKSRILSKYYATSTPKIFILDKEKNIKLKKVPAENLDAVLVQMLKVDGNGMVTEGE